MGMKDMMLSLMVKQKFSYYTEPSFTQFNYQFIGIATFKIKFRYVYTENILD